MDFKKYLISKNKGLTKGQSVIEYVIIFIAITLIAGVFISKAQSDVFQPYFNATVNQILE